ncbi:MAG TPA: hypothetical protein VEW46_10550 [Pyrinomonadaceae bacterium]|nr:hypothetical protein [Pyrinomonadaceae bacterium]
MVDHPVIIRGLSVAGGSGARPTILQRTDQEFIAAILDELSGAGGLQKAVASVATPNAENAVLKLFQPVHRTFYVAMVEVACDTIGTPRLDPTKIESAGLVVRRVAPGGGASGQQRLEAWVQSGKKLRGWEAFNLPEEQKMDPDPSLRRPELMSGNDEMDRRLSIWKQSSFPFTESVAPLFTAPPEICRNVKRTILYGVVPVTSSEVNEPGSPTAQPAGWSPSDIEKIRQHLPFYLQKPQSGASPVVPAANSTITFANARDSGLENFVLSLRQLQVEFDAFGLSTEGRALLQELNRLNVDVDNAGTNVRRPFGDFLKDACEILVEAATRSLVMPKHWPVIDQGQEQRILNLVVARLNSVLGSLMKSEGRFDEPAGQYRARAFVRVSRSDGCPPKIWWSEYSQPFTIAPWYDSNGMPPVKVQLPDPFNKDFLKNLKSKPNVAFAIPEGLFNLLRDNTPEAFLKGEGRPGGGGFGLDWICGFNIPIITLCAFIVLNIFLSLLNIIFWWIPLIKICIPFPKKQ